MVRAFGIGIIFGLLFSDITAQNECTNCRCCNHNNCIWGGTCIWGCKDGYWGNKCHKKCNNNMCGRCDRDTGLICSKCVDGYYGSNCEHICQPGQYVYNNNECRRCGFSGCTCNSHWDCYGCLEGYYANQKYPNCLECPTNCKQCTAWCVACEDGYYPNENGECINCSVRCLEGHCDSVSGKCKEGCSQGFWGKLCNQKCNASCNTCNRFNGKCLECASNRKYGPNCDMNCSETCDDKECCISGKCTKGCLENYFGDMCEHDCDQNCIQSGHGTRCSAKSGKCLHGCTSGYTAAVCLKDPQGEQETSSGSRADAIGGAVAGSVILIVAIIAVIAFIALRKGYGNKETSTCKTDQNDEEHVDSSNLYATVNKNSAGQPDVIYANTSDGSTQKIVVSNPNCKYLPEKKAKTKMVEIEDSLEIDDEDAIARDIAIRFEENGGVYYNNANEVNKTKVKVDELTAYVSKKTKSSYEEEFKKLPYGLTKSYEDSQKATIMSRNRYKGIYPYDDSRVKVWYNGSDYINASFIDGYRRRNEYIATLGPMSKQLGDFGLIWEMVWQQKVEKVVMVTNLIEEEKEKCEQYWPDVGSSARYGNVNVTCLSEDEYAEFTRRTFQIYQSSEERKLYQFHFTSWPDRGVPEDVPSLIEFRKMVLNSSKQLNGPTLVHCSAGVGRTGTYIAFDILTKEGEAEGSIDVPGCVLNMRRNRPNMIQTLAQYQFLHRALVYSLSLDCNPVKGKCYQQFVDDHRDSDKRKLFKQTQEESQAIERNKNLKGKNRANADIQVPV